MNVQSPSGKTLRRRVLTPVVALALLPLGLSACAPSGPVEVAPPGGEGSAGNGETQHSGDGSRANPFPVGTRAKFSADSIWTLQIGETDPDAWEAISAHNGAAREAADDKIYVTVPVRVEANQADSEGYDPATTIDIDYVTSSGNTFSAKTSCWFALPELGSVWDVEDMFAGASAEFLSCVAVPEEDVAGGTWRFSSVGIDADSVFFAGAP